MKCVVAAAIVMCGLVVAAARGQTTAENATKAFVAALPEFKRELKADEKQPAIWWGRRDLNAETIAVELKRASAGDVAVNFYVGGDKGGVFRFVGKLPADGKPAVIVLLPGEFKDSETAARAASVAPRAMAVTPGEGAPRVTAVWSSGSAEEIPAIDQIKAEVLVASQVEAQKKIEKMEAAAKEMKAVEYTDGALGKLGAKIGDEFVFRVRGSTKGTVWGSGPYTNDSVLPAAAVHAGILKDGEVGLVRVTFVAGEIAYAASEKNGVRTQSYGRWGSSFVVERVKAK